MDGIESLLNVAIAEEGYLEKSKSAYKTNPNVLDNKTDGVGKDNYTKYARDLANINYFNSSKQGIAWCAVFISWCFYKAFGKEKALQLQCQPTKDNCGAGCSSAASYYKKMGQFYTSPNPGDQIFFKSSSSSGYGHTGIVERVEGNTVYTIEGNTSNSNDVVANGGSVRRKSYSIDNSKIAGYGRPNWSLLQDEQINNKSNVVEIREHFDKYTARVIANSGKTVNLRKTASENSSILIKIPVNETVTVNCYIDDTWLNVSYKQDNGDIITGYMMGKYLEKIEIQNNINEKILSELNNLKLQLSQMIINIDNIFEEVNKQ